LSSLTRKARCGGSSLRFYISDHQVVFSAFGSSSLGPLGALLWYHSNGIVPSA
jgi:hypothetical protein